MYIHRELGKGESKYYTGISHFRTGNQSEIDTDEKDTDIRKPGIYISYIFIETWVNWRRI